MFTFRHSIQCKEQAQEYYKSKPIRVTISPYLHLNRVSSVRLIIPVAKPEGNQYQSLNPVPVVLGVQRNTAVTYAKEKGNQKISES